VRTRWLLVATLLLTACGDGPEPRRTAPSGVPSPSASRSPAPSPTPTAQAVRLTGDGIDTPQRATTFGETFEQVQPALVAALGEPSKDTGVIGSFSAYGTCPGSKLRVLEFDGGALRVLFGDAIGPGITMYQWALVAQSDEVPQASALVGDVTTYEFGVGDTVAELRAGVQGGAELEVEPGDEMIAPSFTLLDQSSGFFGFLSGTSDRDTVRQVQAGESCGE
jgi:hypothetical protein